MRFLFFALFIFIIPSLSAQGVSMSPSRLFFTGHPGETVTETVLLTNNSDKNYALSIHTKDWEREEDGNKIYFEAESLNHSNASWISTLEKTVDLPATSRKEIQVTMQIPQDASDTEVTNSMLFFTQLPDPEDQATVQGGIGIITLFEFGLHIYYTPPSNNLKSLEITNMEEIVDEEDGDRIVAISITNDGNVVNDATVEFELTDVDSGEEITLEPRSVSLMPQTDQVIRFVLPDDISGSYLGVTIIKMAGTNDLRVGEKNFTF